MNEQMQDALVKLIEKANAGIDASVNFLSAEIPDVVHQLLMWYAIKGALFCLIAVITAVAWVLAERFALKKMRESRCDTMDFVMGYGLIGCVVRIAPIGLIGEMANLDWLQIMIAPKIWLIEYAASLAK